MTEFYLVPGWFFGFDIVLELIFGIVTALVAFYSWKVYSICEERSSRVLTYAFTSISISYFLLALLNLLAASSQTGSDIIRISLKDVLVPSSIWIYAYILFFIAGLSMLAYLTFNTKDQRLFVLIASLAIVVIVFSERTGIAFNFVAAVLLFYVFLYYLNRASSRNGKSIAVAFLLLFFARISFAFSHVNSLPYVANHLIELIAYSLILISLLRVIRR